MLIDYIHAAMRRAKYETLGSDEGYVGTIRGFRGLIGHAKSLEACREDLFGALQSWLLIKLRDGDNDIPVVEGINLASAKAPRRSRNKATRKAA